MTTPIDKTLVVPGLPAPQAEFEKLYVLTYVAGATQVRFRNFRHDGDLSSAINRGRIHCEKTRCRFICVTPFIEDLERIEKKMEEYV